MFSTILACALWTVAAAAAWTALVAVSPVRSCPRCKGRRAARTFTGRYVPCNRCKRTGRVYRLGAVRVQRALREHAAPWIRQRIGDAALRLRDAARDRRARL